MLVRCKLYDRKKNEFRKYQIYFKEHINIRPSLQKDVISCALDWRNVMNLPKAIGYGYMINRNGSAVYQGERIYSYDEIVDREYTHYYDFKSKKFYKVVKVEEIYSPPMLSEKEYQQYSKFKNMMKATWLSSFLRFVPNKSFLWGCDEAKELIYWFLDTKPSVADVLYLMAEVKIARTQKVRSYFKSLNPDPEEIVSFMEEHKHSVDKRLARWLYEYLWDNNASAYHLVRVLRKFEHLRDEVNIRIALNSNPSPIDMVQLMALSEYARREDVINKFKSMDYDKEAGFHFIYYLHDKVSTEHLIDVMRKMKMMDVTLGDVYLLFTRTHLKDEPELQALFVKEVMSIDKKIMEDNNGK